MNNKILKTAVAFVLIILIVSCNYHVFAVEAKIPITKEATNLDDKFNTKVTLSINPDEQEEKIVDIVYVLDVSMITDSMGNNLLNEAYNMISEFNSQEKIRANVALVIFSNGSKKIMDLTDCSTITSSSYMRNKIYSLENLMWLYRNAIGSNLQSAMIMAKDILDSSSTGSKPEDRHVIVATDGGNYTYNNSRGETATTVYKTESGAYMSIGNADSSGDFGSTTRDTKMSMYYDETGDYKEAFSKLMQEQDEIEERANSGYKWKDTNAASINALVEAGALTVYNSVDQITNLEIYPYTNLEVGTAMAAKEFKNIKEEGYKIHTIGYLYGYGFNSNGEMTNKLFGIPTISFLKWTESVGELYFKNKTSITAEELADTFSQINSNILQKVIVDSYIIDEMGFGAYSDGTKYDLDFVNDLDKIDIYFNNEELDKTEIEPNVYGFGADDTIGSGYKYILRYYPNGIDGITENECFKVDVNYEIGTGIPFKVEYEELLNDEYIKKENGEYGKYDKDGSKSYSGLKANKSAILYLANGLEKEFKAPTLSYIVDNPIKDEEGIEPDNTDEQDEKSKDKNEEQDNSVDSKQDNTNRAIKTEDKILFHYINIVIALLVGIIFYYKKNKRCKKKSLH